MAQFESAKAAWQLPASAVATFRQAVIIATGWVKFASWPSSDLAQVALLANSSPATAAAEVTATKLLIVELTGPGES